MDNPDVVDIFNISTFFACSGAGKREVESEAHGQGRVVKTD